MQLVDVAQFSSLMEADIAASLLRGAGIDHELVNENLVRINPIYAGAVGGVRIRVREEDAAIARDVLEGRAPDRPLDLDPTEQLAAGPPACPECGAPEPRRVPVLVIAAATAILGMLVAAIAGFSEFGLLFVFFGFALLVFLPNHRCTQCGHRWTQDPSDERVNGPDATDLVERPSQRCTHCGSEDVYRLRRRAVGAALLVAAFSPLFSVPLWLTALGTPAWRCRDCGRTD